MLTSEVSCGDQINIPVELSNVAEDGNVFSNQSTVILLSGSVILATKVEFCPTVTLYWEISTVIIGLILAVK